MGNWVIKGPAPEEERPRWIIKGVAPEETQGWKGVGEDVLQSIKNVPGVIGGILKETPRQLGGAIYQHLFEPERAKKNIGLSFLDAALGAYNSPRYLAKYRAKKGFIPEEEANAYPEAPFSTEHAKSVLGLSEDRAGDALLQASPYLLAGGAAGGLAKNLLKNAAIGSTYAGTHNESPITGALAGAALPVALSGIAKGIPKIAMGPSHLVKEGMRGLSPAKMLRGNLSAEELLANLEAAKGTETNLGRVIGSPFLAKAGENVLPSIMGSGAESSALRTAGEIKNRATKLVEKTIGDNAPANYGVALQEALKENLRKATKDKNELYRKVNELDEKSGKNVGRDNFNKAASEIIDDVNKSEELKREFSPALLKKIEFYSKSPGNNLKLTNIFKSKLNDVASEHYIKGQTHTGNLIKKLSDSLNEDIESHINNSGNEELKIEFKKAQKNYKENFAPFDNPDIIKFTRKGGDPDLLLQHFIKGGKNDRSNLMNRLKKLLSSPEHPEGSLLTSAYLHKSFKNGHVDPLELQRLYKNLGDNQAKTLFGDKLNKELKSYSNLVNQNKDPLNLMFNPKTGARNTELISKLGQLLVSFAGANPVEGIGKLAGIMGGSRVANKILTSEKLRTSLVKAMLENEKIKKAKP